MHVSMFTEASSLKADICVGLQGSAAASQGYRAAALISAWLGTSGWMGSRLIQQSACKLGTAGDYAYRAARPAAGQGSGTDSPTVAGQGKGDCCGLPVDFAFE